jgi:zinc transport system ATP-binding protein
VIEGATYSYGAEPAVQDVSLSVRAGDFAVLIGPNGSGKSTLLRMAVGLLRPKSGEVRLFGEPLPSFREWPRVGYVPQLSSARAGFPASVAEVVSTGRVGRRGLLRRLGQEDRRAVEVALDSVGMLGYRRRPIGELSGGQQQRVMLARSLAGQPELLMLDEPTSGVDAEAKLQLLRLLRRLCADSGLGVLYVSHDLETLRPYCNRVALLNRRLLFFGPPQELGEREDLRRHVSEASLAADHHHHGGA